MGFWHGANWTFIIWGLLAAGLLLVYKKHKKGAKISRNSLIINAIEIFQMGSVFILMGLITIFFRAESASQAIGYFIHMVSHFFSPLPLELPYTEVYLMIAFLIIEWLQKDNLHGLEFAPTHKHRWFRWVVYYGIIAAIIWWGSTEETFIYFQF